MYIEKYKLRIFRHTIEANGQFEPGNISVIAINTNLTAEQAKVTIAHELAHFFYQYELDTYPERIERRFNTADMADLGGKISEMIAHIVGHYGAEIQQLTDEIISQLWKEE